MNDPWIAVAVAGGVLTIFMAGLLVQRRPRWTQVPLTEVKLNEITTRLTALEGKQTQNDHDVRNIRQSMENMPTIRSVHALELKVEQLSGKVENVSTGMVAITSGVDRIENFLMEATAKAIAGKITEVKQ